jgi:hypothetical protein
VVWHNLLRDVTSVLMKLTLNFLILLNIGATNTVSVLILKSTIYRRMMLLLHTSLLRRMLLQGSM